MESPTSLRSMPLTMFEPPSRRKRSARFDEIAKLASVSKSTVDRVLNERGSVSDKARRRVVEAARALGIPRILPTVSHGVLRFDVVFQYERDNGYYQRLARAFTQAGQLLGSRITVHRHYWTQDEEARMLRFLRHPPHPRHGLLIVARDSAHVREALREQEQRGVHIVTLTSDISELGQRHYTGIDNRAAGRTAAYLLGGLAREPGRVLMPVTSMAYHAHIERAGGFCDVLQAKFPHLTAEAPIETFDDDDLARRLIRHALRASMQPVVGIYNMGEGNSGVLAALKSLPRTRRPVWITHEATDEHRELMHNGHIALVLDQDPEAQVLSGLRRLMFACGELDVPPQAGTRFRLITPENLETDDIV